MGRLALDGRRCFFWVFLGAVLSSFVQGSLPVVVNTWNHPAATELAWQSLNSNSSSPALDAVEQGCNACEEKQCGGTVGFGGSPDEEGEVSLDALIMDGTSMDAGSVASLRHVKQAITAARLVLERTQHTTLAGLQATQFAVEMGLGVANLSSGVSNQLYREWKASNCQPNFRRNVLPDPTQNCGPFSLDNSVPTLGDGAKWVHNGNHDTFSVIAIDKNYNVAAGSSANGLSHKISGRVGDAAVAGAGAYADSEVGGCGATGDGDIHLRFLPCYQVVEYMRAGMSPEEAAFMSLKRVAKKYRNFTGAVVAVNRTGHHGAAAYGWNFYYSVRSRTPDRVEVIDVTPFELHDDDVVAQ